MLDQLLKKNTSTPPNKTSNTKAKIISIQTEVRADSKSAKSSKQTKNSNTKRIQNKNKKMTQINLEQSTPLQKCSQRIYKENADNIQSILSKSMGSTIRRW